MLAKDIKIGQRVLVKQNDMTALVVGRPEYYTHVPSLYELNTRTAHVLNI